MLRQLCSHVRQASAQAAICASSPIASHDCAHAPQITAHSSQWSDANCDLRAIIEADIVHDSAQSLSSLMWSAATCFPPCSAQYASV